MKNYDYILSIDPSGSFHEGQGTTGWVLGNKFGRVIEHGFITAKNFKSPEAFWQAHNILIAAMADHYKEKLVVVIEDYLVYADKAQAQINSRMETCRLLGVMQVFCFEAGVDYHFQRAVDVKSRWSNEILESEEILYSHGTYYTLVQDDKKINRHEIDALRHMLHFATFKIPQTESPKPVKPKLKSFYNYHDRSWEGRKE
jgi:hypothetical protein